MIKRKKRYSLEIFDVGNHFVVSKKRKRNQTEEHTHKRNTQNVDKICRKEKTNAEMNNLIIRFNLTLFIQNSIIYELTN